MNTVRQPCAAPQTPMAAELVAEGRPPAKRVLIVDDDRAVLRVTARFLSREGYVVDAADDPECGWRALASAPYDLLITDNNMPRLTGLNLVARLRSAGLTLPVIIASASSELGDVDDYPGLSLAAILRKPFEMADLITAAFRVAPLEPDPRPGFKTDAGVSTDGEPLQHLTSQSPAFPNRDSPRAARRRG